MVERRREQAAEDARSRPAQAGIPFRHSGRDDASFAFAVIPAQAGIQYFISYIPAGRE